MSRSDRTESDIGKRKSKNFIQSDSFSIEKFPKNSESQTITINLYQNPVTKKDKPVQTETPYSPVVLRSKNSSVSKVEKLSSSSNDSRRTTIIHHPISRDNSPKKSTPSTSYETVLSNSMDPRKNFGSGSKHALNGRPSSDLERKKLEAELKAAEEIAKIRQSVIEKRLALELASLQDDSMYLPKIPAAHQRQMQQADFRNFEEMALKKQATIENNLAQELRILDSQNQLAPMPPVKPPPVPDMLLNYKGPILNGKPKLGPPDPRASGHMDVMPPPHGQVMSPPDPRYAPLSEVRYQSRMEDRFVNYPAQGHYGYNGPMMPTQNNHSAWKSMMSKMKRKFKSGKPPPTWQ